jgi:predicted Zn finger-like uncharacterized protein
MIILCTRCQAKFRVADEKIGPRGAKVRCSKCGNVFGIHRDAGPLPPEDGAAAPPPPATRRGTPPRAPVAAAGRSLDIELEAQPDRARSAAPPPASAPYAAPDDPFAAVRRPAGDPFFAARETTADPFAAAGSPPDPDPFAPSAAGPGAPAFDPSAGFDEAALGDPFFAAVVPRAAAELADRSPSLPVTDLSDLLGAAAGAGGPAAAEPSKGAPAALDLDPAGFHASDLGRGAGLALETAGDFPGVGLELDQSPPGFDLPFASPDDAVALDPEPPPASFSNGLWGAAEPFLAEAEAAASAPPAWAEPPTGREPSRIADPAPAPPAAPIAGPGAPQRSPLRGLALNAVSLAALLLLSVALLVVWRGGGSVSAALRSTPLLAGLAGAPAPAPRFPARDVSSGLFDRAEGAPILYVRGTITSRAPNAVAAVRVAVEILRGDAVVARGEALAGAVPTPEDVHAIRDAADLSRRAGEWTRRAPVPVPPGAALPFLVALLDVPADLTGTTVRVSATAVEPER